MISNELDSQYMIFQDGDTIVYSELDYLYL